MLIGGAMAYTFLQGARHRRSAARGSRTTSSNWRANSSSDAANATSRFVLPVDHVVASAPEAGAVAEAVVHIPTRQDGSRYRAAHGRGVYRERLASAHDVIWNGPLGLFELPAFAQGTLAVGEAIANLTDATSVIGGGDTAAAVAGQPWANQFTHISTGGGATLEYLEGWCCPASRRWKPKTREGPLEALHLVILQPFVAALLDGINSADTGSTPDSSLGARLPVQNDKNHYVLEVPLHGAGLPGKN